MCGGHERSVSSRSEFFGVPFYEDVLGVYYEIKYVPVCATLSNARYFILAAYGDLDSRIRYILRASALLIAMSQDI